MVVNRFSCPFITVNHTLRSPWVRFSLCLSILNPRNLLHDLGVGACFHLVAMTALSVPRPPRPGRKVCRICSQSPEAPGPCGGTFVPKYIRPKASPAVGATENDRIRLRASPNQHGVTCCDEGCRASRLPFAPKKSQSRHPGLSHPSCSGIFTFS